MPAACMGTRGGYPYVIPMSHTHVSTPPRAGSSAASATASGEKSKSRAGKLLLVLVTLQAIRTACLFVHYY
eukprot:2504312-Rhodomonas_salina.1